MPVKPGRHNMRFILTKSWRLAGGAGKGKKNLTIFYVLSLSVIVSEYAIFQTFILFVLYLKVPSL